MTALITATPAVAFDYTILYVNSVSETVAFYEQAFGLEPRLVHESLDYAEMHAGTAHNEHVLSFAGRSFIEKMLPVALQPSTDAQSVCPMQISLRTQDVQTGYEKALAAGALPLAAPEEKPWGQTVAFVRDINGFIVELRSSAGDSCSTHA